MSWKEVRVYRDGQDVKLTFGLKQILARLFINPDYKRMKYKVTTDVTRKRIIIDFKHDNKNDSQTE